MSRKRKKQTRSSTANTSGAAFWRKPSVVAVGLVAGALLVILVWSLRSPQETTSVPPALDALERDEIDPAILESLRAARQQVVDEPTLPERWGHLGLVFAAHALNEEAATCFATAAKLDPDNQRWAYLRARCQQGTNPEEAMAILERCADLPGEPLDTPRLVLVEMLLERHELDAAQRHLKQSLLKNEKNPRARFAQARLHFLREEYEACRDLIVATHRDIKGSYQSNVNKANALAAGGQRAEAKAIVDAANRELQANLRQQKTIGTMLATAMYRLGDNEAGRKQQELADQQSDIDWSDPYTRGIDELKTGLKAMLSNSDIAYSQTRYDDALAILDRAVAQYPESLFARIRLGRTLIRLGRMSAGREAAQQHYLQAEQQLNAALSLDADSAEAHFRLGILMLYWAELGNDDQRLAKAEQQFRRAISIKSDFAMAYYNLARCLDKQGKSVDAIAAMRESLELEPSYLPARRALGGLLMKAGRLPEAAAELQRVLEDHPDDKQARSWLELMRRQSN